jgi:beta-N-acetylglucosaminidase
MSFCIFRKPLTPRVSANKKTSKRLISIAVLFIMACMIVTEIPFSQVYATIEDNATIVVSNANVRVAPGTLSKVIGTVTRGDRVEAIELVTITDDPNGYNSWYKIKADILGSEQEGYIVSAFVSKDPTQEDTVFEEQISEFPDSYKPSLRALHEVHPLWTFQAVQIDKDWSTVVKQESIIGRSLIHSSADDSFKSTAPEAYDWTKNLYTPYDGKTWVNAAEHVISYYLDPRNFLSEMHVFMFLNLSYDSETQKEDAVQKILKNTFMQDSLIQDTKGAEITYAKAFIRAAKKSGSSPYQLVSRVLQEVSPTGSRSTSGKEKGYENLFNYYNIGASSSEDPVILGLNFARYGSSYPEKYEMPEEKKKYYQIPWNTPYRSIMGGAVYISGNYIQMEQFTPYFQKFDVTDGGNGYFAHQYMTNIEAMIGESSTLYKAYSKSGLMEVALTFCIPVYPDMPELPVPQPEKKGNPNNYLQSLSVSDYSLTPTFSPETTSGYSLIVPFQVTATEICAKAVAKTSVIKGQGDVALEVGKNSFTISVTAQNGDKRDYSLVIIRSEAKNDDLFATDLAITQDGFASGIEPASTFASLAGRFTLHNDAKISFLVYSGDSVTDLGQTVKTGDKILISDKEGVTVYEFTIVIFGDANHDGKISSSDLTIICRHVLGETTLSGADLMAADVNHDKKTSSSDLTMISRHILGDAQIKQP